jgi:hypothetical protein
VAIPFGSVVLHLSYKFALGDLYAGGHPRNLPRDVLNLHRDGETFRAYKAPRHG